MTRSREGSVYLRHDHETCTDGPHRCRGRWVAALDLGRVNGRRKRSTSYHATEREALAALRRMVREKDAGRLADDALLRDWLAYWLAEVAPETAGPRTVANYRSHADVWIVPALGSLRLSQIRPEDVRRLRRKLETTPRRVSKAGETIPRSPSSVRAVLATLDAAMRAAERERRITWNPVKSVTKPKPSGEHHPYLTEEQARAVLDAAANTEEQARHAVALYAGLRQGEALGLEWAHVDFAAGVLRVRQTAYALRDRTGGMGVKPGAKTAWSVRDVPMHPVVRSALEAHAAGASGPFVFGGSAPMNATLDHRRWKDACRRADVPAVPLHGARSTCATILRDRGVPVSTIGAILGHRPGSPITILSYAHAQDAELRAAIERL